MDFSGIEIHNPITNAAFTGKGGPLDRYNTQATARALRDKGLSIPAFDSSVDISAGKQRVQDAKDLIDLAQAASVPVCVASSTITTPSTPRSPSWSPTPKSTAWCC